MRRNFPLPVALTCLALVACLALLSGCDCAAGDGLDGSGGNLDGAGGEGNAGHDAEGELTGVLKDGPPHKLDTVWSDILGSNTDTVTPPAPDKGSGGAMVSTLAGIAKAGHANGAAATAQFNFPSGLAVDKNESVYVADQNNNRVRVVFNKLVADVAGSGSAGYKDGPSATAQFFDPMDVAVDSKGNVYVADQLNDRIRLISGGKVSTLAGSGTDGFKDGPAATAQFADPAGIAVDSKGNVYVADQNNDRVRLISGGKVSTLTGSGTIGLKDGPAASARFDTPIDVVVDKKGKVYVADQNNHCVRMISGGTVKTVAGDGYTGFKDGPVATAQFNFPTGLALGPSGKLYVADQINARIRVITW